MNGGTAFVGTGGVISMYCLADIPERDARFDYGHILIQRVDGFF